MERAGMEGDTNDVLVLRDDSSLSRLSITQSARLGGGAGGRVVQGTFDGVPCAVKIMHPSMARRHDNVAEFMNEAHLLARLSHGNIIRVLAICHLPPAFCNLPTRRHTWGLVLELAKWGPMADLIRNCQSPPAITPDPASPTATSPPSHKITTVKFAEPEELCPVNTSQYTDVTAVGWCLEVARALHYLHSQKPPIIHRDVKPDNILLVGDAVQMIQQATAKLADFGSHLVLDATRPGNISMRQHSSSMVASESTYLGINRSMGSHHSLRSASITASRRRAGDSQQAYGTAPSTDAADRRSACSSYAGATVESTAAESLARRLSSFLSVRGGLEQANASGNVSLQVAHNSHSGPRDGEHSPVNSPVSIHTTPWRPSNVGVDALDPSEPQVMSWEQGSPVGKACQSPARKKSTLGLPSKAIQSRILPVRSASQATLHHPKGPLCRTNSTMDEEDCNIPWTRPGRRRTLAATTQAEDNEHALFSDGRDSIQDRPTAPNPSVSRYSSLNGSGDKWPRASSISGVPLGRTDASVLAAALQSHMSAHLSSTSAASNARTPHALSTHGSSSLNIRKPRSRTSFTTLHAITVPTQNTGSPSPVLRSSSAHPATGNTSSAGMTRMSHAGPIELLTGRPSPHSSRPSPSVNLSKGPSFSMPGGPIEPLTASALAGTGSAGPGPLIHQYLEGAVAAVALPERETMRTLSMLSRGGGLNSVSGFAGRLSEGAAFESYIAPQLSTHGAWLSAPIQFQDAINEDAAADTAQISVDALSMRQVDSPQATDAKRSKRLRSNPSSFSTSSTVPSLFRQVASARDGPGRLMSRASHENSWAGSVQRHNSRDSLLMTRSSARVTPGSPAAAAAEGGELPSASAAAGSAARALPVSLPHRHSSAPYTAFNKEHGSLLRRLQHNLPQTSMTSEAEGSAPDSQTGTEKDSLNTTTAHGRSDKQLPVEVTSHEQIRAVTIRRSLEQAAPNTSQGGVSNKHSRQRLHTVSASIGATPGSGASLVGMISSAGRGSHPTSGVLFTESEVNGWSLTTGGNETVYAITGRAGTSIYMSPEMAREEPYNEKSDVYSFAIVMYEMLSRMLLLTGRTREEVDYLSLRIQAGHRPRRTEFINDDDLWGLITWCWSQDAASRPTMAQVVHRLSAIHQDLISHQAQQEAARLGNLRSSRSQRLIMKGGFVMSNSFKSSKGNMSIKSRTSRGTVNTGVDGDRTSASTAVGVHGVGRGSTDIPNISVSHQWDAILEPPVPQPACCRCTIC